MDETAEFNGDNLKMLVLDEVDRLMDLGFKESLDSIIDFLPKDVQTLMFSATIGKKVKDLMKIKANESIQNKTQREVSVHNAHTRGIPEPPIYADASLFFFNKVAHLAVFKTASHRHI